ncbi:MAG: hypothetical protein R3Y28_08735 [Candidatus Gastranaerophilales bacterium]
MQNEFIPRFKYTLTDINLLFPTSDYHKERRFILWYGSEYITQVNKLKSIKDGYIVAKIDFDNKDNIFSDWDSLHKSKRTKVFFDLLIYGDLSKTQKQAILDFYKMRDNAYYELALEVCEIKNPKSMKDFEGIQEKINKLTYGVGYP